MSESTIYAPPAFQVDDENEIWSFVETRAFGLLVTTRHDRMTASHLPFLVDRTEKKVDLIGHFAKANTHWKNWEGRHLAVFDGPDAYVSPRWCGDSPAVPTWLYQTVHAQGEMELVDDDSETLELLKRMSDRFEPGDGWSTEREAELVERLLPAVVGFRLRVAHVEGVFKLNQHHSIERRQRVAGQLEMTGAANEVRLAAAMR
ncbi:MAG: FMN-binding negative transcriptional regulator, partial [Pirellulaceae bacterium]|nr:FMN-binding negative transcriptional regulator [Pirellulaceae bacterium]